MIRVSLALVATLATLTGCDDRSVFGLGHDVDARDGGPDARSLDVGILGDAGPDAPRDARVADTGLLDVGPFDAPLLDGGALDGALDAALDAAGDGGPRRGPSPVLLGSATDLATPGAYALIGKTGITNVIGSAISGGHLGVSPASSTALTGFALVLDPSGEFSTSIAVVPPARVYAADYSVPTPSNLTSAILGMESAYADAAGRSLPDFVNLSSGHLGGLVLEPGLYTFGSSVDVTAGVTLSGGANDVWIFQITGDLDLSTAVSMTLTGGARAENVFWQVAGTVTLRADSHCEGILLGATGITLETGASLHGRALAQTLVALDDNAITAP